MFFFYLGNCENTREKMEQSTTDGTSQYDKDDIYTSSDELSSSSFLQ